jgi:hypothetical protein
LEKQQSKHKIAMQRRRLQRPRDVHRLQANVHVLLLAGLHRAQVPGECVPSLHLLFVIDYFSFIRDFLLELYNFEFFVLKI